MRLLYAVFGRAELCAVAAEPPLLRDVWLDNADLQLMAARAAAGTTDGLYVAAWGAHNGQSHNHNDVGNFLVYHNGQPALVDVGRPTYTRQTFSRDRYTIWAMQSAYHNLPTVNGQMQQAGSRYAAADVRYRSDDAVAELQLDLAPAYPEAAGIQSWLRTVRLQRGECLQVTDTFALREQSADIVQHLMTPCEVQLIEPGRLRLHDADAGTDLLVCYEPPELQVRVETIPVEDDSLRESWGSQLRRVSLQATKSQMQGTWTLTIRPR
jgi:hypothetical protein